MLKKIVFVFTLFISTFVFANERYYDIAELAVYEDIIYDNMGEEVNGIIALKVMPTYDFFVPYQNGLVSDGSMEVTDKMGNVVSEFVLKNKEVVSGFDIRKGEKHPLQPKDKQKATETIQMIIKIIPQAIEKYQDILSSEQERIEQDPLYQAADVGDLNEVEKLVKAGADVNYICEVSCQGWTPVMIAAANGHEQVVHYLLENGADPNIQNRFGRAALHYVAKYNFRDIAKDLLEHGANPNLESINDVANTPVKAALLEGHIDMLKLLLSYGGDKNVVAKRSSIIKDEELKKMLQ
ncbi:MAG: ankyrin repeat domain-containing protein [Pseudomonadota bacterium]|nr:ankyrin repeat domain-containing protein [Pseudomonadota bacterium]